MTPVRLVKAITFCAAGLSLQPLWGQVKGTTGTPAAPATPAPSTTGTRGTAPNTLPGNSPTTPSTPPAPSPIYLSGRVALEDGSPPPLSVSIERVCNGSTHTEGFTNAQGYFGITLGNESGVFQDASDSTSYSTLNPNAPRPSQGSFGGSNSGGFNSQERLLSNCELRAKLAGYRSQSIMLAGRRAMDDPNVGTILLHRQTPEEHGTTVSASSLAAPKTARKAFEQGQALAKKNKLPEALRDYQRAVELYPGYAAAWCELGTVQAAMGQTGAAHRSLEEAINADPRFVNSYLGLSIMAMQAQKWQELAEVTDSALKLNRFDYPQEFLYNAVAYYHLKNYEAAEKSARAAERLDVRHEFPDIPHILGVILAHRGDFAGAIEHLHIYLDRSPRAGDAAAVRIQLAEIEKLSAANGPAKPEPVKQ
jgi:tetratricopeptide (TPR) repeat protein